jgi:hypothetical protein
MLCEVLQRWLGLLLAGKKKFGFSSWLPHVRQSIVGALIVLMYLVNAEPLCTQMAAMLTVDPVQEMPTDIVLVG